MPNETTLYAVSKAGRKLMVFANVQSIAYSDALVYDGEVYVNDFDISRTTPSKGFLEDEAGNDVAPDPVKKEAPKLEQKKRSIITLTCTKGVGTVDVTVFRDEIVAGALFNVNPFSPTVTANTFYAWTQSGLLVAWDAVTTLARSNEEVFEGETYRHDFDLSNTGTVMWAYLTLPGGVTKSSPDSVMGTAPRHLKRQRSIVTVTITHDAGTLAIRVFRDELRGGDVFNSDPLA